MRGFLVVLAVVVGVLVLIAACGGGGSSGWSKSDQQRFKDDEGYETWYPAAQAGIRCALRVARDQFDSYAEFARAVGNDPPDTSTEAGKTWVNDAGAKCGKDWVGYARR